MIEGFVFAQEVDDGFPGSYSIPRNRPALVASDVILVIASTYEEALQYLIDNPEEIEYSMSGAYEGLYDLAAESSSVEELKQKIYCSYVNGDSAALVICHKVELPELPTKESNYYLSFAYSTSHIWFNGV